MVPGCIIELSLLRYRTDLQRQPNIPGFLPGLVFEDPAPPSNTEPLHKSCVPSFSSSNHLFVNVFTGSPFVDISVPFLDPSMI
jgi:hypothetical protein